MPFLKIIEEKKEKNEPVEIPAHEPEPKQVETHEGTSTEEAGKTLEKTSNEETQTDGNTENTGETKEENSSEDSKDKNETQTDGSQKDGGKLPEEIPGGSTQEGSKNPDGQDTSNNGGENIEEDGNGTSVAGESGKVDQVSTKGGSENGSGDGGSTGGGGTSGGGEIDLNSNKRYVDQVSTKTDFDKVLDSLAAISKDLLSHEVERFAKKYADKYQGEFTKAEADAKKYEAFLGGYITNAAMTLYENNYMDAAIRQLDQAKNVLIATQKLKTERAEIKERVEEEGAAVDLSDILGMFGDG